MILSIMPSKKKVIYYGIKGKRRTALTTEWCYRFCHQQTESFDSYRNKVHPINRDKVQRQHLLGLAQFKKYYTTELTYIKKYYINRRVSKKT